MSGREKKIMFDIPTLYKKQAIDLILFGYVCGMTRAMPAMSAVEAIQMFLDDNSISEDEYPKQSAQVAFYRMRAEFVKKGI